MPTKNDPIDLTCGTLYIYPPEGGGPVQLGEVKSLEVSMDPAENWDELGNPLPYINKPALTQEVTIELEPLSLPKLFLLTGDPLLVINWAAMERPKLLHLAAYAKSARRRKKSRLRIIREFIREALYADV